jgi:hypothetical protein
MCVRVNATGGSARIPLRFNRVESPASPVRIAGAGGLEGRDSAVTFPVEASMFSRETGMLMRVVGPLIEVVCLVLLFSFPGEDRRIGGLPLRPFLYGGIACGLLLVIAGLTLARREVPTRPFEKDPVDPVDHGS